MKLHALAGVRGFYLLITDSHAVQINILFQCYIMVIKAIKQLFGRHNVFVILLCIKFYTGNKIQNILKILII